MIEFAGYVAAIIALALSSVLLAVALVVILYRLIAFSEIQKARIDRWRRQKIEEIEREEKEERDVYVRPAAAPRRKRK